MIIDAGMNDLIRPSLYQAFQDVWPVEEAARERPKHVTDLVGPYARAGTIWPRTAICPSFTGMIWWPS